VAFKDLGLLIVDEEQRFGVKDKERLKAYRASVDIMTLTATPIPRTLHMSMMGIRDLSIIDTPPVDRLAIKTVVARDTEELVREAIMRELERRRPGLLCPQPGPDHRYCGGTDRRPGAGGPDRRGARPDGGKGAWKR
jgi:RecG-like helicase